MSSAILYLAIIAIWLCVLIPRWLKRDSARGAVVPAETAGDGQTPAVSAADAEGSLAAEDSAESDVMASPVVTAAAVSAPVARPAPTMSAEEARRRIMTGRRRLLGMLILLEIAAITLAVVGLAALWVIIPPTIMLVGYLLLLREAAHVDAERAQRAAETAAHARERAARARARAQQRAAARPPAAAEGAAAEETSTAAALAARFAAAPVPADYEDAGRDFAPGLAGKYTTSNADSDTSDDNVYEIPRLRAVGD